MSAEDENTRVVNLFTRRTYEAPSETETSEEECLVDKNAQTVLATFSKMVADGDAFGSLVISFTAERGEPLFSFSTPEGEPMMSGVVRMIGALEIVKDRLLTLTYPDDEEDDDE